MHLIPQPGMRAFAICFMGLVWLGCSATARAATLAEYGHRVSQALAVTQQLHDAYYDQEPSLRDSLVINSAALIREQLPVKETVVVDGQSVVVDNTWLHEALRDYEKTNGSKTQHAEALARIEERLRALSERIQEMQRGQPAARDKDSDKGKLAEILRRPDFNKPVAAEGGALSRLWQRFLRWLSGLIGRPKPLAPSGSPFISGLLQIVIVVVCVGGLALLIWKLAPRYLKNRRAARKQKREARIVLGERLEPDQTSADLLAQAELLARNGDLRAAIRKAYIALLCELADRKIVSLAQHKTNRDYLNSVRERTRLHHSMRQLTRSFELHWYGFRPAAENDWNEFRRGYQEALREGPGMRVS